MRHAHRPTQAGDVARLAFQSRFKA
jgi:hypothetical protein